MPTNSGITPMSTAVVKSAQRLSDATGHPEFEFDYLRNVLYFKGKAIHLSPQQSDILRVLLNHRARPISLGTLIQRVYGITEPDQAAASIRVAIHALRKKIEVTGMIIRAQRGLGYEIDASEIPELNRRICDQILLVLNRALAANEREISGHLQAALAVAEIRRESWIAATQHKVNGGSSIHA